MKHTGTQPIETDRLLLRRFVPEDAASMYKNWTRDPKVARWMRWAVHEDESETRQVVQQWVNGYADPSSYLWAIEEKASGQLVGSCSFFPSEEDPAFWEPGYNFARTCWGKGYGTEALGAMLDYFTGSTGQTRLYCCHATENPASGRVMQKNGFVYLRDTHYTKFDGAIVPAKLYCWQPQDGDN